MVHLHNSGYTSNRTVHKRTGVLTLSLCQTLFPLWPPLNYESTVSSTHIRTACRLNMKYVAHKNTVLYFLCVSAS